MICKDKYLLPAFFHTRSIVRRLIEDGTISSSLFSCVKGMDTCLPSSLYHIAAALLQHNLIALEDLYVHVSGSHVRWSSVNVWRDQAFCSTGSDLAAAALLWVQWRFLLGWFTFDQQTFLLSALIQCLRTFKWVSIQKKSVFPESIECLGHPLNIPKK